METRNIDGWEYQVEPLGFKEGRRCLVRLIKLLGPTLANTLQNLEGGLDLEKIKDVGEVKVKVIGTIVQELTDGIDDETLDYFCRVFGEVTLASGEKGQKAGIKLTAENQELHFKAAYDRFFKWLWFCLEVNYSGFTGGLTSIAAKFQRNQGTATGSMSTSPQA